MSLEKAIEKIAVTRERRLQYVDLRGLGLDEIPETLHEVPWIESLALSQNAIRDLAPLASFRHLKKLVLNDNRIVNIAPVAQIATLTFLEFSNNRIADCEPLRSLPSLKWLSLKNNPLDETECGDLKQTMPSLYFFEM